MFKSFFVAFNDSENATAALEHACNLAALAGGKVHIGHVLELTYEPSIATGMLTGSLEYMAGTPALQSYEDLDTDRKARRAAAEQLLEKARVIGLAWGVECMAGCLSGFIEEEVLTQARAVDLVALGQSSRAADRHSIGHLTEAIIRASPQPVLIATAPFAKPTEIVVLYNGGERAQHALGAGASLAREASLPLELLIVVPSSEEGRGIHQCATQYLNDLGVPFHESLISSPEAPGEKLLRHLDEHPMALVLMGAFGESRLREWLAGSTTRAILRETRNSVILFPY